MHLQHQYKTPPWEGGGCCLHVDAFIADQQYFMNGTHHSLCVATPPWHTGALARDLQLCHGRAQYCVNAEPALTMGLNPRHCALTSGNRSRIQKV
jgi:hypothetical protein